MKKKLLVITLSVIMLFCGCDADSSSINKVTLADNADQSVSDAPPSASAGIVIPYETNVYAAAGELAGLKPLFESYLSGNDLLAFAVSAVFANEVYLMGFVYENNEDTLPFSRVIGLKQNGTSIEEAFISDNYKPDPNNVPENLMQFQDEPFYDTQAFEIDGMLVVKTNESLEPDCGLHNFFLLNEKGLLDNHINYTLYEPCELLEYEGKLLLNESYSWYEFTVKDEKIALNEITDAKPYLPQINEDDFVVTLNDFKPATYNEYKQEYNDDNDIKVNIDGVKTLDNEDFNGELEDAGWGAYPIFLSKEKSKINIGTRIILLYPPEMKINCSIRGEMDDSELEHSSLPGAAIMKAQQQGNILYSLITTVHI